MATIRQTPELPEGTERDLRQCLRQLELLKTVWLDVLPNDIYCRAVGQYFLKILNKIERNFFFISTIFKSENLRKVELIACEFFESEHLRMTMKSKSLSLFSFDIRFCPDLL